MCVEVQTIFMVKDNHEMRKISDDVLFSSDMDPWVEKLPDFVDISKFGLFFSQQLPSHLPFEFLCQRCLIQLMCILLSLNNDSLL
mmetsp:Transcript_14355/g.18771  ORF Transcript_14355/g.18771 Transcript_14355/m.18771 type:complete len:85 (-) Transcript_14355:635-889(-)